MQISVLLNSDLVRGAARWPIDLVFHRRAATNNDGGAGIRLADYMYEGYVRIPFEVWDIDNNQQLMISFRDQADDGAFNLIPESTSGSRDESKQGIHVRSSLSLQ